MRKCPPEQQTFHRVGRPLATVALLSLTCLFAIGEDAARAEAKPEALRPCLTAVAGEIKTILRDRAQSEVALGPIASRAPIWPGGGTAIQKILREELARLGVKESLQAAFEAAMEYEIRGDDAERGEKADNRCLFLLHAALVEKRTGAKTELTQRVALDVAFFDESLIPYGVEVLVLEDGQYRQRPFVDEQGRPFAGVGQAWVRLKSGEPFALRLANRSPYDAVVRLSIDGLDVFAFNADPQCRRLLVPKGSTVLVAGWRRQAGRSDRFVVGEYSSDPRARRLVNADEWGTVCAVFAACWREPAEKPVDELGRVLGQGGEDEQVLAEDTAAGRQIVQRHVGRNRAILQVRYAADAGAASQSAPPASGPHGGRANVMAAEKRKDEHSWQGSDRH